MIIKIKYSLFAIALTLLSLSAAGQCGNAKLIEEWGNFDNWVVREIKESGIIGGNIRHLYETSKGDTIKRDIPYVNPD